jgi:hypothetical protein
MDLNPYTKYDTLEQLEDLQILQNLLSNIENEFNKKVKITMNFNLVNPDYDKISLSNFNNYYYKSFTETYQNRDSNDFVWNKLQELLEAGFIKPQFHGREHVNFHLWMAELKKNNKYFRAAFDVGCYGIDAISKEAFHNNLMASFEYKDQFHKELILDSIIDGLNIFSNTFNYESKSIVPTRHVWSPDLERHFNSFNLKFLQTSLSQLIPVDNEYKKRFHYTGQLNNDTKILYLVRNVFFEPAYSSNINWVDQALKKIRICFLLNIPVIISMHRINFVGGINKKQRDENLLKFKLLLVKILTNHKNVQFLTSDELGDRIVSSKLNFGSELFN